MQLVSSFTPTLVWSQRKKRAERLRDNQSHAAELLSFYEQILKIQEPIFVKAYRSSWLRSVEVSTSVRGQVPWLQLNRLPRRSRERAFVSFVKSFPTSSTEILRAIVERLRTEPTTTCRLLEAFLNHQAIDDVAASLDCAALPLEFFPRAFVQPITEALARRVKRTYVDAGSTPTYCPYCGSLPFVSVLRDGPDIKGRRTLCCSLCASEWMFPRSCCPNCGEQRPDELEYHVSELWSHVRVEECRSCRTYLKAIDLRVNGLAVPVVDELASVELDLWASERGMAKLRHNVLGL